jgi:PAS domain S-box-containing protein
LLKKHVAEFSFPGRSGVPEEYLQAWRHSNTLETEYFINGVKKNLLLNITPGIWCGHSVVFGNGTDITERKRIEEKLKESNAGLHRMMNSMDAAVYIVDMHSYEILFINDYIRNIFGEVTGKKCWEIFQNEKLGPCQFCNNDRLLDADGAPAGICAREFSNPVTGAWYDCRDLAIKWTDDRIVRMEIATDITLRKQAEQNAKLINRRFKEAQEVGNVGSWEFDFLSNKLEWSDQTYRIYGESRESFEPSFEKVVAFYPDGDRESVLEALQKAARGGGILNIDHRVVRRDGSTVFVHESGRLVCAEDGTPLRLTGCIVDISSSKRLQQELEMGNHVLAKIAAGSELSEVLDALCRFTEEMDADILASVLLLDSTRKLLVRGAAPSLPADYNALMDVGLPIGPEVGSCGTAAFTAKLAVVADIQNDPRWIPYAAFIKKAREHDLNACWSMPILSSTGNVLGAFANYHRKIGQPSPENLRVLGWATQVAAMAIERQQAADLDMMQTHLYD